MSTIIQPQLSQIHVPLLSTLFKLHNLQLLILVSIKRSPLTSVINLPGDTPKYSARFKSPLNKHLEVISAPLKEMKTGANQCRVSSNI